MCWLQTYYALGLCKHDPMSLYRVELDGPFVQVREHTCVPACEWASGVRKSESLPSQVSHVCLACVVVWLWLRVRVQRDGSGVYV